MAEIDDIDCDGGEDVASVATPGAKDKERRELASDVERFLANGGKISEIESPDKSPKGRQVW